MGESLEGALLKLRRAEHHIAELDFRVREFMESEPYSIALQEVDREAGELVWAATRRTDFPRDEIAVVVGDILQNLRAALDIAICAAMRFRGLSDYRIQFPTADSFEAFQKAVKLAKKKNPLHPKIVEVLESLQPYAGGRQAWIHLLHRLANRDKHRLVTPVVAAPTIIYFSSLGFHCPVMSPRAEAKDDGRILIFTPLIEHVKVGQGALGAFSVRLDLEDDAQIGKWGATAAPQLVHRLAQSVAKALEAMNVCFS